MNGKNLTPAMEDYIETIYLLEQKNKVARVSEIGRSMKVRKASVVSAVSNLRKQDLINHEKYGFITLTQAGRETAETVYKKHKIILEFLENILKVEPEKAIEEACKIEHVLSGNTVDKLSVFLEQFKTVEKNETKNENTKNRKVKKNAASKKKVSK